MDFLFTLKFLKIVAASIVIFILLDFLWLAVVASKLYSSSLGFLANLDSKGKVIFNIPVGVLVQATLSIGLSFVIGMSLQLDNRLIVSVCTGAFVGFVIYMVYDFTNLSFVKGWPLWISLVDAAWGTTQGLLAGFYIYYFNKLF
jgi:uncharacterized membrane protein